MSVPTIPLRIMEDHPSESASPSPGCLFHLGTHGWTVIDGIKSRTDLLRLASSIGRPVPSPSGEIVKELRVTPAVKSRPTTLSSAFGEGAFPLHTDTAFWPTPARYIVLRACGDLRRPTTILPFSNVAHQLKSSHLNLLQRAVWTTGTSFHRFYCSIILRDADSKGWRYDPHIMRPANTPATVLQHAFSQIISSTPSYSLQWAADSALVVCNWNMLHGRGEQPANEGTRIIERLYVR